MSPDVKSHLTMRGVVALLGIASALSAISVMDTIDQRAMPTVHIPASAQLAFARTEAALQETQLLLDQRFYPAHKTTLSQLGDASQHFQGAWDAAHAWFEGMRNEASRHIVAMSEPDR